MKLDVTDLVETRALINGEWVSTGNSYTVFNPATQLSIAEVAKCGDVETNSAIDAASRAFIKTKNMLAKERGAILSGLSNLMLQHENELAIILTTEQGKSFAEAKGEVVYAASFLQWFAEEAKRVYGDIIPSHKPGCRVLVTKNPIGVVGAITPWNFPLAMFTRKLGAAFAAGCSIIWKPSEETPLSANALGILAILAGFPVGSLNIISGDPVAIGNALMASDIVRKISFTGSTKIGKLLMQQAAATVKRVSMELGGNAPFIVFEDADLDAAVDGAMVSKFRNNGQTCICANRFYIHDAIYDKFVARLLMRVRELKIGNGLTNGVTTGPLINQAALNKVVAHVADAKDKGGEIVCGGKSHSLGGLFYEPTVIVNATADMLLANAETFGPVVACFRFYSDAEVVRLANNTNSGLAGYFYTRDLVRAMRVADLLDLGMIGINEAMISSETAPFGGIKESGVGREGSRYGIDEYTSLKYILLGGL
jgi:succinate-semialdehyde dehydrogenase / glutarate-semialdehyde dehydrogenase